MSKKSLRRGWKEIALCIKDWGDGRLEEKTGEDHGMYSLEE